LGLIFGEFGPKKVKMRLVGVFILKMSSFGVISKRNS